MSDNISLHTINKNYNLIDLQNDLIQCSNLLSQTQRATDLNDLQLAKAKLSQLKQLISQIDKFQLPYSDDLESQSDVIDHLRVNINDIKLVYSKLNNQLSTIPENVNIQETEEESITHGTLPGQIQYSIQHTPISAEQIEIQQQDAIQREIEIQRISQSVNDINTIFGDLDSMIQSQSTIIGQIENSIFKTVDYLRNGDDQISRANSWQRRTSSCQRLLLIITLIIFTIILLVLFV